MSTTGVKTNLSQFLRQFTAHQKIALEASQKTINATMLQMYKKIIDRTPVGNPMLWKYPAPADYIPGTLKKSWQIDFNGQQRNTKGQFQNSNQTVSNYGLVFSLNTTKKQTAIIYNPQPYAQRVETGWSSQAPAGMMRITIAEYTTILSKNAQTYRIR